MKKSTCLLTRKGFRHAIFIEWLSGATVEKLRRKYSLSQTKIEQMFRDEMMK